MLQLWAGLWKIGKTVQANSIPGGTLFVGCEPGQNHISAFKYKVRTWDDLLDCLELCEEEIAGGRTLPYQNVAIDTVSAAYDYCRIHMLRKLGVIHESDADMGKGWSLVQAEFQRVMTRFAQLGLRTIYLTHIETKEKRVRGGGTITTQTIQLDNRAQKVLLPLVDAVLIFTTEWNEAKEKPVRVIKTDRTSGVEDAGIRLPPDFMLLGRKFPKTLPMSYRHLIAAWDALKPSPEEAQWLESKRAEQEALDNERIEAEARAFAERVRAAQTRIATQAATATQPAEQAGNPSAEQTRPGEPRRQPQSFVQGAPAEQTRPKPPPPPPPSQPAPAPLPPPPPPDAAAERARAAADMASARAEADRAEKMLRDSAVQREAEQEAERVRAKAAAAEAERARAQQIAEADRARVQAAEAERARVQAEQDAVEARRAQQHRGNGNGVHQNGQQAGRPAEPAPPLLDGNETRLQRNTRQRIHVSLASGSACGEFGPENEQPWPRSDRGVPLAQANLATCPGCKTVAKRTGVPPAGAQ